MYIILYHVMSVCSVTVVVEECRESRCIAQFFQNILYTEPSQFRLQKGVAGAIAGLLLGQFARVMCHNQVIYT